jgi:hypothetical protein
LSLPPERCPATMRLRWAPLKTSGRRAGTGLSAPACAMPVVWPRLSCTPRAALAFAITDAIGSLGQEIGANTIESQNMERSGSSIRETLARSTGSGLSAALSRSGRGRCIIPKWIFSPFAHYSGMIWQRLLYHRIIFRLLTARIAGILKLKGNCLRRVWHALRCRRILCGILPRFPIAWNPMIEKRSLNINRLEHTPKEFVNFSGSCTKRHGAELCFGSFAKAWKAGLPS